MTEIQLKISYAHTRKKEQKNVGVDLTAGPDGSRTSNAAISPFISTFRVEGMKATSSTEDIFL